jgi:hypothetical protein
LRALTASTTTWWWLPSSNHSVTRPNTSDIPSHHLLLLLCQSAGVDREHNQLVVAIIDFIRTYTWDKQLETWVKASGILGGSGKEPTIVSPKQYMRRFRAAISSYFTVVPDGHEVEPPLDPDAA